MGICYPYIFLKRFSPGEGQINTPKFLRSVDERVSSFYKTNLYDTVSISTKSRQNISHDIRTCNAHKVLNEKKVTQYNKETGHFKTLQSPASHNQHFDQVPLHSIQVFLRPNI